MLCETQSAFGSNVTAPATKTVEPPYSQFRVPTAVSPNLEYGVVRRFSPNRPRRAWLAKHIPSLSVTFLSLVGTVVPCGSPGLSIARGLTPHGKTADGAVLQVGTSTRPHPFHGGW
jgi:hypothetical protein